MRDHPRPCARCPRGALFACAGAAAWATLLAAGLPGGNRSEGAPGGPPANPQRSSDTGPGPRKRALLVGISRYNRGRPLDWHNLHAGNDVQALRRVLIDRFGFPADQILVLTDAQATRRGILDAFRRHLIAPARPGDVVLFHFSGHGQQIRDDNGDELDGLDESLVPFDYITQRAADGEKTNIRDDLLGALLQELKARMAGADGKVQGSITVTIDCCFSGTATRGRLVTRGRGWNEALDGPRPPSSPGGAPDSASGVLTPGEAVARGYVFLSACENDQQAKEITDAGGRPLGGAFTYQLVRALAQATPQTTYRALFERVSAEVSGTVPEQNPQLEGEGDHLLFSGAARPMPPYLLVQAADGDLIVLPVGTLHGVAEGCRFALYRAGSDVSEQRNRIADAVVTEVGLTTCRARVTRAAAARRGAVDLKAARAVETAANYGERRLRLLVGDRSRWQDLAASLEMATIDGVTERNYDVWLRPESGRLVLERKSGSVAAAIADDDRALQSLRAALLREWRWQFLAALHNEGPEALVRAEIRLAPVEVQTDGEGRLVKVLRDGSRVALTDGSYPVLRDGDYVMIELRNLSPFPVYVTVLALHPDGNIAPIFPHPLARGVRDNQLPAGDKWTRIQGARPEDFVFVMGEPYGLEIYKVIVTRDYADFSPLFDEATRRQRGEGGLLSGHAGPANPLATLLLTAADGKRRRGGAIPSAFWGVADLPFVVQPRASRRAEGRLLDAPHMPGDSDLLRRVLTYPVGRA
jgi:uncharacterized caspase-like protein